MSAIKFAVSALNRDKPHSSITDWVEILTSAGYDDEVYDGIPEIIHSIELQPTGTAEASRAIRKKLKHGDTHSQYRAIVILNALVENCGRSFQMNFADTQLIDAIKHLATDHSTNPKLKKKILSVLSSWNAQFKDDPLMSSASNLYRQCRPADRRSEVRSNNAEMNNLLASAALQPFGGPGDFGTSSDSDRRRKEKEEKEMAKKKAKQEKYDAKEKTKKSEKESKRRRPRPPFNFDAERPKILTTVASASQVTNNLVNAIKLVNAEKEHLATNERVQDCLAKVKEAQPSVVRYIQLVENEDVIGTLIETNERMIGAIELYTKLSTISSSNDPTANIQTSLASTHIDETDPPRQRTQKQRVERDHRDQDEHQFVHPDLHDLSFDHNNLPPPLLPSTGRGISSEDVWDKTRGSLSDYSDYESDDEPNHMALHMAGSSGRRVENEDPFADPFAD